jgi:hypothetical protein
MALYQSLTAKERQGLLLAFSQLGAAVLFFLGVLYLSVQSR